MNPSTMNLSERSVVLAREARELIWRDLTAAALWLREHLETAASDPQSEVWPVEAAYQVVSAALHREGAVDLAQELDDRFAGLEARDLERTRLDLAGDLDGLGRIALALAANEIPAEPELPRTGLSTPVDGHHRLRIRAAHRREVPAFLRSMREIIAAEYPDGGVGSFTAYEADEALEATDMHCLMVLGPDDGVVGGSVIMNTDSAYPELGPAVVAPEFQGLRLATLVTAMHCVHQSYLDPDRRRLYWSAVPTGSPQSASALRQCGFNARGDVWTAVGSRLQDRVAADKASWLAATPRAIAMRLMATLQGALAAGAGWTELFSSPAGAFDVEVEVDGAQIGLNDMVPIAAEVTAYS